MKSASSPVHRAAILPSPIFLWRFKVFCFLSLTITDLFCPITSLAKLDLTHLLFSSHLIFNIHQKGKVTKAALLSLYFSGIRICFHIRTSEFNI